MGKIGKKEKKGRSKEGKKREKEEKREKNRKSYKKEGSFFVMSWRILLGVGERQRRRATAAPAAGPPRRPGAKIDIELRQVTKV